MEPLNGRTKGAIVGLALAASTITTGIWASSPGTTSTAPAASSCSVVFAGRAGTFDTCKRIPDDRVARNIKIGVGNTFVGCALGLASGGPAGAGFGCLGGLASIIPWNGWAD